MQFLFNDDSNLYSAIGEKDNFTPFSPFSKYVTSSRPLREGLMLTNSP